MEEMIGIEAVQRRGEQVGLTEDDVAQEIADYRCEQAPGPEDDNEDRL